MKNETSFDFKSCMKFVKRCKKMLTAGQFEIEGNASSDKFRIASSDKFRIAGAGAPPHPPTPPPPKKSYKCENRTVLVLC